MPPRLPTPPLQCDRLSLKGDGRQCTFDATTTKVRAGPRQAACDHAREHNRKEQGRHRKPQRQFDCKFCLFKGHRAQISNHMKQHGKGLDPKLDCGRCSNAHFMRSRELTMHKDLVCPVDNDTGQLAPGFVRGENGIPIRKIALSKAPQATPPPERSKPPAKEFQPQSRLTGGTRPYDPIRDV